MAEGQPSSHQTRPERARGAHVGARRLSVGRGTWRVPRRPGTCEQRDPCTRLRPVIIAHADWRQTLAKLAWQGPAPWDHSDCRVSTPRRQDSVGLQASPGRDGWEDDETVQMVCPRCLLTLRSTGRGHPPNDPHACRTLEALRADHITAMSEKDLTRHRQKGNTVQDLGAPLCFSLPGNLTFQIITAGT